MFDIAPTELLLCAVVALMVIGPKDLPKAMRVVGYWVGRARGVARHFRSGFDTMVREAELEEMEKKWAAENERIMREHPAVAQSSLPPPVTIDVAPPPSADALPGEAPPEPPVFPAEADPAPAAESPEMLPMALPGDAPKPVKLTKPRAKKA